jgi:hypothetical protein
MVGSETVMRRALSAVLLALLATFPSLLAVAGGEKCCCAGGQMAAGAACPIAKKDRCADGASPTLKSCSSSAAPASVVILRAILIDGLSNSRFEMNRPLAVVEVPGPESIEPEVPHPPPRA